MGLFATLRKAFRGWKGQHPLLLVGDEASAEFTSVENSTLALRTVWAYAAMRAISTYASDVPVRASVLDADDRPESLKDASPQQQLVFHPNALETWGEFIESCLFWQDLWGYVPIHLGRDPQTDLVISYKAVRPDYLVVEGQDDPANPIKGYRFEDPLAGHEGVHIPARDIAIHRHFSPVHGVLGMSPAEAMRTSLLADWQSNRFNVAFFSNNAMPGVILRTDRVLTKTQRRRLTAGWKAAFGGATKSHGVAILSAGLDVKTVTPSHREMAFHELKLISRNEILTAYGVPPVILGVLEGSTFATAQEQRHSFFTGTLKPRLTRLLTLLDKHVFEPMGAFLVPNFENFLTTTKTLHERRLEVRGYWRDGLITRNEARENLGFDPVEGGDVFIPLTQAGTGAPVPAGVVAPDLPEDLPEEVPPGEDSRGRPQDVLRTLLIATDAERPSFASVFARMLSDQTDASLSAFQQARRKVRRPLALAARPSWLVRSLDAATQPYVLDLESLYREVASATHQGLRPLLGSANEHKPESTRFSRAAAARVVDLMTATTRDAVLGALRTLSDAEDPEQVIRKALGARYQARVRTAARNEVGVAANAQAYLVYQDSHVEETTWHAVPDGRGRASHAKAHGQIRPLGSPFIVGETLMIHPHHVEAPVRETAGCRCWLLPRS